MGVAELQLVVGVGGRELEHAAQIARRQGVEHEQSIRLAARAMLGMSGTAVTSGALGNGATRTTWNQIRNFLIRACGVAGLAP